jgi:hypothetical protein
MEAVLSVSRLRGRVSAFGQWAWRLASRPWTLARAHGLNPWVFVFMAVLGHVVEAFVFLPAFRSPTWQLVLLIALRLIAMVVPLYIWTRGRGIAAAFNISVAAMFVFNTAWHVCYFVYA